MNLLKPVALTAVLLTAGLSTATAAHAAAEPTAGCTQIAAGLDNASGIARTFTNVQRDVARARRALAVDTGPVRRQAAHLRRQGTPREPAPRRRLPRRGAGAAVPVAVVSNSPRPVLDIALSRSGFADLVDFTVSAEDTPRPKPAPDPYLLACRRFGLEPGQTLAVEDSPTGLASARAAGTVTLGVPTLTDGPFGADWTLDSLVDPALMRWTRTWTRPEPDTTRACPPC